MKESRVQGRMKELRVLKVKQVRMKVSREDEGIKGTQGKRQVRMKRSKVSKGG